MLTRMLPSRMAPITRSIWPRSRLTIPARRSPRCSSSCRRGREAAVSAVSEPAKKAQATSSRMMAIIVSIMAAPLLGGQRPLEQRGDRVEGNAAGDEGLADAARQHEGDAAAGDLLVALHVGDQA